MNHFIEYICRSTIRSEDAICRLNKNVTKLAKCVRNTNTGIICLCIAGILTISVVAMQDREIEVLKKQVADLTKAPEDATDDMEEQTQQEGA